MKSLNYKQPENITKMFVAAEPEVLYAKSVKDNEFSVSDFEMLQKNIPFSLTEWADILHLSDRTLQRYIKEGKSFEGLYSEHLQQLKNMSELGLLIFKTSSLLKEWLIKPKDVLGNVLDFKSLKSFWGVKLISNELGRIAYGVYI
ncbi:hypothetical protein [Pseudopedobacter sp.]|uniref:hypothetical protein n=1 Tax=Pseudopedobacter sp. TaxID=1936787 RepID=UPI00333F698B